MKGIFAVFTVILIALFSVLPVSSVAEAASEDAAQFADCILPMPKMGELSSSCWGADIVGPRDQMNGLEDTDLSNYSYWDGGIIKDESSGKYYMFASRWLQSDGFWGNRVSTHGWKNSRAVYATSDNLYGPYTDKGELWPDWCEGAGHNVFPFEISKTDPLYLEGYRYAIVVSDVWLNRTKANGTVHISKALNGKWELMDNGRNGKLNVSSFIYSNVGITVRPDGGYFAVNRYGDIIASDSLAGKWTLVTNNLWKRESNLPQKRLEDPAFWYSNGLYHIIVNKWDAKNAYYLISTDGINDWTLVDGIAYSPRINFLSYEDGTVNKWTKIERPNVYMENGEVMAMTFAVVDCEKEDDKGNDTHASKVIVVPFSAEKAATLDASVTSFSIIGKDKEPAIIALSTVGGAAVLSVAIAAIVVAVKKRKK